MVLRTAAFPFEGEGVTPVTDEGEKDRSSFLAATGWEQKKAPSRRELAPTGD